LDSGGGKQHGRKYFGGGCEQHGWKSEWSGARDLQKQQQEAKDYEAAIKADEKLQRRLEKEEKRRSVEQRKQQHVQDKEQREREATAKKAATQEAKEAKQAERQLEKDLKQAQKWKKDQINQILAMEEVDIETAGGIEVQIAQSAGQRPQRQKKLPYKYDGNEM
jgi:hypothetical protein